MTREPGMFAHCCSDASFSPVRTARPRTSMSLDIDGLLDPAVTFFSFRWGGELLGVGALKRPDAGHGELKPVHPAEAARG